MEYDGRVIIDTAISKDGIEKGFRMLKNEVGSVGDAAKRSGEKVSAAFSGAKINKTLENARHKVEQLQEQLETVNRDLDRVPVGEKSYAKLESERDRIYERLAEARRKLALEIAVTAQREAAAEEKAAERSAKAAEREAQRSIKAAEKEAAAEARAMEKKEKAATKPLRRFNSRMRELITGALFFNLVSSGLTKMMRYFGTALKSSDAFSASLGRLKGALLTAFQPIYEAALPALISLMNVLTAVINAVGRFFAAISGKSYKQMQENAEALKNQADGINAVGGAAKKAQRDLAGFDEINKLSSPDTGGGGGGSASGVPADFTDGETIANLNHILYLVGAIGAALLTWKISSLFTDSLKTSAGLALTIGGAFLYGFNWADAFANGINWKNLSGMLLGMAGVVGGLWLAFGKTSGTIGLLITSIGLVIVAIKDWIETGELGIESCMALVAGIMGIGAVIGLLTGSWIPVAVAAVAALAIAAVTNGDKIKAILKNLLGWTEGTWLQGWLQVFNGIIDFFNGVFTGNWEKAWLGLKDILRGIINIIIGLVNGLVSGVCSGVNAVIRALNRIKVTVPDWVPAFGGKSFGFNLNTITAPQIPYLAKGAVIPPNREFLAVLGDQTHGTNVEAPLSTIQEAVAVVMDDMLQGQMAGFEAVVEVLREILEAIYGIEIGDEVISKAAQRYQQKLALAKGR